MEKQNYVCEKMIQNVFKYDSAKEIYRYTPVHYIVAVGNCGLCMRQCFACSSYVTYVQLLCESYLVTPLSSIKLCTIFKLFLPISCTDSVVAPEFFFFGGGGGHQGGKMHF